MSASITAPAAPLTPATRPVLARRGWRAPAIAPDVWLLAVSLAAGLGTARLTQAPGALHVVGPIIATVVAGHVATSVARRLRVTAAVALAAGVVVVVLATIWGQLASATRYGIPTPGTWRTLVSKFEAAGTVIRSHPTPVPATPEVVLCIATGAGLVAVLTRSLWGRQEARGAGALPALVPTFGLFCYTALLSSQVDRLPGAIAYLACVLAFVIVADRSTRSTLATGARAMLPAVLGAALAVIVPLAVSPGLATLKVNALPFGEPTGQGYLGVGPAAGNSGAGLGGLTANSGPGAAFNGLRAIDLVDNLRAVLVNRTTELMFDALTPVPTYWQVAVLTRFDGTTWSPDPTTQAAAQSDALSPPSTVPDLPPLPEPQSNKTFNAQVTIANLQSTLLPLPPTTVSVNADAVLVPGFGGIQAIEAQPGLSYSAVARLPVNPAKAPRAARSGSTGAATTVSAASLAPYLAIPPEPASVVALAHQIVAGVSGPAAQAAALARWFDTGRYRYTLSPPVPTGSNALESFLFTTRAGFCQQFAAAYGVLARIDGLPTRVAVGFTTGTWRGHGLYRVTGADAHVWPEVYLGPSAGWTSYEPTPASSGEATGVGVNTGAHTSAQKPGARSTSTTPSTVASIRHLFSPNVPTATTIPLALHGKAATVSAPEGSWRVALKIAAASAAVVAVLVLAGLWVRALLRSGWMSRRLLGRRRRRRAAADPSAEVLARWREAERLLERARLGKRPAETLEEHASRLRSLAHSKWLLPYRPVTGGGPSPAPVDIGAGAGASASASAGAGAGAGGMAEVTIDVSIDAYGKLSALAARASYASDPCTSDEAADAELLGDVVRAGLARPAGRRRVAMRS